MLTGKCRRGGKRCTYPLHFFSILIIFGIAGVKDMERTLSLVLYREGNKKAMLRSYASAFEDYAEAFLSRLGNVDLTAEFVMFYRYQLLSYLKSKPVFTLSLPEGDMISDLIKDAYDDFLDAVDRSPFNITGEGRANLLESVRIIFPWHNDTDSLSDVN